MIDYELNGQFTPRELNSYGDHLGMDYFHDGDWQADEVLVSIVQDYANERTDLTSDNRWQTCITDSSLTYFFNAQQGKSVWRHPADEYYFYLI